MSSEEKGQSSGNVVTFWCWQTMTQAHPTIYHARSHEAMNECNHDSTKS
jgi:hypothetical protein